VRRDLTRLARWERETRGATVARVKRDAASSAAADIVRAA
jgi:hypothetical protein